MKDGRAGTEAGVVARMVEALLVGTRKVGASQHGEERGTPVCERGMSTSK